MFLVGNWKSAVLQKIDADQLPVHWGGTQTDPDGDIYCRSKVTLMTKCIMFHKQWFCFPFNTTRCNRDSSFQICVAGPVPKKYYSNHMDNFDLKSFTTATVGRGSSLQLDYDIDKPGNLLRYRYLLQWLIFCKEYTF